MLVFTGQCFSSMQYLLTMEASSINPFYDGSREGDFVKALMAMPAERQASSMGLKL